MEREWWQAGEPALRGSFGERGCAKTKNRVARRKPMGMEAPVLTATSRRSGARSVRPWANSADTRHTAALTMGWPRAWPAARGTDRRGRSALHGPRGRTPTHPPSRWQHPAHHVAAEDVQDHIEVEVGPLLRPVQLGDVPAPHLIRLRGDQLGFFVGRVGRLAATFSDLVVLVEDPVHGGTDQIVPGPRAWRRRCRGLVDELVGLEQCLDLLAFDRPTGPGAGASAIRSGRCGWGLFRCRRYQVARLHPDACNAAWSPRAGRLVIASSIISVRRSPLYCPWRVAPTARKVFPGSRRPVSTCRDRRSAVRPWPSGGRSPGHEDRLRTPRRPARASGPWSRWRRQLMISEEYRPSRRTMRPGPIGRGLVLGQDLGLVLRREPSAARRALGDLGVRWSLCRPSHQHVGACLRVVDCRCHGRSSFSALSAH